MGNQNKKSKLFSLSQKSIDILNQQRNKSQFVDEAIEYYFNKNEAAEDASNLFLKKFDEKYKTLFTRIRLGVTNADRNSDILLLLLNAMMLYHDIDKNYIANLNLYPQLMSPALSKAKEVKKEELAYLKQKNDNKSKKGN